MRPGGPPVPSSFFLLLLFSFPLYFFFPPSLRCTQSWAVMKLQLCLARCIHARHMLEIIVLGGALQNAERFNRKEVERSFISTHEAQCSPRFTCKRDWRQVWAQDESASPVTVAMQCQAQVNVSCHSAALCTPSLTWLWSSQPQAVAACNAPQSASTAVCSRSTLMLVSPSLASEATVGVSVGAKSC